VTCITTIDTIIHHILTNYTNDAYLFDTYTQLHIHLSGRRRVGWFRPLPPRSPHRIFLPPLPRIHLHRPYKPYKPYLYLHSRQQTLPTQHRQPQQYQIHQQHSPEQQIPRWNYLRTPTTSTTSTASTSSIPYTASAPRRGRRVGQRCGEHLWAQ
jgi:hypothetical protein